MTHGIFCDSACFFGGATLVALIILCVRLKPHLHCHVEAKPKHLFRFYALLFFKGDKGNYLHASPITCFHRKCLAFATRLSLCAKRCFNPQSPSTLFNCMCSARTMSCPTARRQRYAYGSNIAAVRCGWDYLESRAMAKRCFASLNMTRFHVSLRASTTCERGNQQAENPNQVRIPTRLIATRLTPLAMTIETSDMRNRDTQYRLF